MKTAPRVETIRLLLSGAALGAVFFALPVFADTGVTPQTEFTTKVRTAGSSLLFRTATTTQNGTLSSIVVIASNSTGLTGTFKLRITCFANTYSSSQTGCTSSSAHESYTTYTNIPAGLNGYIFYFNPSIPIQSGKSYIIEDNSGSMQPEIWGSSTYQFGGQCDFPTPGSTSYCSGAPYFNPGVAIDWSALSIPVLYSSSSVALATSSSLWQSLSLASSTQACASDNFFTSALCSAGTYLFVPNQEILQAYAALPQTQAGHWPFSWIVAVQTAFSSQSASSTANLPTYTLDFASVDPASTTALHSILPSFTALSSTTVLTYIGQTNWNVLLGFVGFVLYLAFGFDVFFTLRNRFYRV